MGLMDDVLAAVANTSNAKDSTASQNQQQQQPAEQKGKLGFADILATIQGSQKQPEQQQQQQAAAPTLSYGADPSLRYPKTLGSSEDDDDKDKKEQTAEEKRKEDNKRNMRIMGATLDPAIAQDLTDYLNGATPEDVMNRKQAEAASDLTTSPYIIPMANNDEIASTYNFTSSNEPSPEAWSNLTQREQFNQTMFDDDGKLTDFGQAIVNAYGDDYGNKDTAYEAWRGSNNRDLTSALFGYGDNEGKGIEGWQDLARRSGVEDLDQMMDYMWGDQAFNVYDYLTNDQYAGASNLGYSDDAAAALANYLWNNYEGGMYIPQDVQGANGVNLSEAANANDFAVYALAAQMAREANGNEGKIDLNRYDVDRINDILGASGEGYMLGAVDENNGFSSKETQNPRSYSIPGLLTGAAMLNPYVGEGETGNLDADLLDTYISLLNASDAGKGKEIGIKGR